MPNPRTHTIHKWHCKAPLTDEQYLEQFKVRFWAYVDKTPGFGPKGDCWLWVGALKDNGYGNLSFRWLDRKFRPINAHVAAFYIHTGELVHGKRHEICHSCDFHPCVNPAHLWKGTHKQNMNDAQAKGRMPLIKQATQVTFRLSTDLREFYEKVAEMDRRRLSDTLRLALEDHAKQLAESAEVAA